MRASLVALAVLAACDEPRPPPAEPWEWSLPAGFPEPEVPADNPMSAAKVELGRHLFYDKRLSHNQTMACGSCHEQALAFSDGEATGKGSTGDHLPRNAMGLGNVAYLSIYTWANPKLADLEAQALVPLFADFPLELGAQRGTEQILARFAGDPTIKACSPRRSPTTMTPSRSNASSRRSAASSAPSSRATPPTTASSTASTIRRCRRPPSAA
jgi:cytochrome c peroxidase